MFGRRSARWDGVANVSFQKPRRVVIGMLQVPCEGPVAQRWYGGCHTVSVGSSIYLTNLWKWWSLHFVNTRVLADTTLPHNANDLTCNRLGDDGGREMIIGETHVLLAFAALAQSASCRSSTYSTNQQSQRTAENNGAKNASGSASNDHAPTTTMATAGFFGKGIFVMGDLLNLYFLIVADVTIDHDWRGHERNSIASINRIISVFVDKSFRRKRCMELSL
jgi:hypothetical protein